MQQLPSMQHMALLPHAASASRGACLSLHSHLLSTALHRESASCCSGFWSLFTVTHRGIFLFPCIHKY